MRRDMAPTRNGGRVIAENRAADQRVRAELGGVRALVPFAPWRRWLSRKDLVHFTNNGAYGEVCSGQGTEGKNSDSNNK